MISRFRVILVDGPFKGQFAWLSALELDARAFSLWVSYSEGFTEVRYKVFDWSPQTGWRARVFPSR